MLKLNVGFTKKVGESNYGSRGAAVNLELELDSSLVGDAVRLKDRIRQLFGLAKASVDEELAAGAVQPAANGHTATERAGSQANGDGSATVQTNGRSSNRHRDGTRAATASQQRALTAIAERQGIVLGDKLHAMFGVRDPAELTITEASSLIDELKGAAGANGNGGRR
ncbi:MAG: hypothetical protein K8U03_00205 [Planctomycetia bacterium]|nr:hypothetical protein [Planctomycetia bacterium]